MPIFRDSIGRFAKPPKKPMPKHKPATDRKKK